MFNSVSQPAATQLPIHSRMCNYIVIQKLYKFEQAHQYNNAVLHPYADRQQARQHHRGKITSPMKQRGIYDYLLNKPQH